VKGVRVFQLIVVVLVALYLWLFHSANPVPVELPLTGSFLPHLPAGFVVIAALLVGWLIGFLPARIVVWRRSRDLRRANQELAELRQREVRSVTQTGSYYSPPGMPVIPDRGRDPDLEEDLDPDEAA